MVMCPLNNIIGIDLNKTKMVVEFVDRLAASSAELESEQTQVDEERQERETG